MNLRNTFGWLRANAFRVLNAVLSQLPARKFSSFGLNPGQIGAIFVINLERQPLRLHRTLRELNRFRTESGISLASITKTQPAVDARDGRNVASTSDVDPEYLLGDQLYVQPNELLEHFFGVHEPVTMTRQEVAVARSHIEVWKAVATGETEHVLILEDDIWFRPGARALIDRAWIAAQSRFPDSKGPDLLYLSYQDADGTAERRDVCRNLFRPGRGLWFLSGYVLSREGAQKLLLAMPVKGPVDMWMNRRFDELRTLALSSPAILQRRDGGSDNSYSVIPYLARAGVIDADAVAPPPRVAAGPLLVWCSEEAKESVAMALSMLGLRVRVFDLGDAMIGMDDLSAILADFDALVAPKIETQLLVRLAEDMKLKFLIDRSDRRRFDISGVARSNVAEFFDSGTDSARWAILCNFLGLPQPIAAYPDGPPSEWRLFRDDRDHKIYSRKSVEWLAPLSDSSAWALRPASGWPSEPDPTSSALTEIDPLVDSSLEQDLSDFSPLDETFPGNLASFERQCVEKKLGAAILTLRACPNPKLTRPYRSGALISYASHQHGRFEAEIKAARGGGLVTGFFLHRAGPRQEIDFEITGNDTTSVLLNVFFNPGDPGTNAAYGYRGSPCRIPLGFDASNDFHRYSIEWRPDSITWAVDGRIIHRRGSWDPTPVPHLPMKLHFNLWASRSQELAGHLEPGCLPAVAQIRSIRMSR